MTGEEIRLQATDSHYFEGWLARPESPPRGGLVLRAVGESPGSAHAIGYPVIRIRYAATLFGGAMAGLGGTFLSVFYTPLWVEGMVAGRGWIALALVVFATWRPLRVLVGAYLFGGVMIAQLFVQGSGAQIEIASQFLSSLPYLATIVVLVLISRDVNAIRQQARFVETLRDRRERLARRYPEYARRAARIRRLAEPRHCESRGAGEGDREQGSMSSHHAALPRRIHRRPVRCA